MKSCDEAALIIVQGMKDQEGGIADVTVGREIWGIYYVAKE